MAAILSRSQCVLSPLTHWGRVMHICVGKLTIIGSDNGLSPGRRQSIIWTNAGILLIGPLGTNFSGILIAIETFSFNEMHWKISSAKWRPFCLGLYVCWISLHHHRICKIKVGLELFNTMRTLHWCYPIMWRIIIIIDRVQQIEYSSALNILLFSNTFWGTTVNTRTNLNAILTSVWSNSLN